MATFENFWEEKINGFTQQAQQMMEQAKEKQQESLGQEQTKLKDNMPKLDRMPPEVLNLEFQINKLAKEQRYTEAHNLKRKLEKLVNFADSEKRCCSEERGQCREENEEAARELHEEPGSRAQELAK